MSNSDLASALPNGTINNVQVPIEREPNGPRPVASEEPSNASDLIQAVGPLNEIHGPSMNSRIKRRPFKHSCGSERLKAVDAWVLLDADGNTQEITEGDVNILLGGRSVDAALAASMVHRIAPNVLERNAHSDTRTTRLEPIIQESLLMLRRDISLGEHSLQRRLSLERKTAHMLLHITQPQATQEDEMQPAPSVHFVNIDSDQVILWRRSQDFQGARRNKVDSFSKGEYCREIGGTNVQENLPSILEETLPEENWRINTVNADNVESDQPLPTLKTKSFNIFRKFLPSKSKAEDVPGNKCIPCDNLIDIDEEISSIQLQPDDDACHRNEELAKTNNTQKLAQGKECSTLLSKIWGAREKLKPIGPESPEQFSAPINYNLMSPEIGTATEHFSMSACACGKEEAKSLNMLKKDMQELKAMMFDSENVIKQSIAMYITDKRVEKQMLEAVESYSSNKIDGEHRMNTLAHDLIEEQVELLRNHRQSSEANIHALQDRNHLLEEENLLLLKKIEKLQNRSVRRPGDSAANTSHRGEDGNIVMKNNDMLRHKLSYSKSQMENMESQLEVAQQKEEYLETQVRSLRMESENHKLTKNRMEADHNIQCSTLTSELRMHSNVLQQAADAAEVVIDDMDLLKKQLQFIGADVSFNWNSLQLGSNSLCDLFHMCRTCINELGKTLINVHKQYSVAEKEMLGIQEEREELRQFLELTVQEKDIMKERLEETCKEIEQLSQDNATLQEHLLENLPVFAGQQQEIDKMRNDMHMEKRHEILDDTMSKVIHEAFASTAKATQDAQIQKLTEENKILLENLKTAELKMKSYQETSKADSKVKKMQETALNELKQANGIFKKEIKTSTKSHDHYATQVIKLEKEIYQASAEKACLADELQSVKSAHKELIQTQYEYCMQIQAMQHETAILGEELAALQVQYDMAVRLGYDPYSKPGEYNTANTDKMVQAVEAHLVETKCRSEQLEYVVKENKNKIEQLEKSCGEKDALIRTLYQEIAEMSNKSQKEILSLQHKRDQLEANEVTIKKRSQETIDKYLTAQQEIDKLNDTLSTTTRMLDSYKYLESEMESIHGLDTQRREENAALRGRLKDYNNIINQRDKLMECQKAFLSEVENLHSNLNRRDKKIDSLIRDNTNKSVRIAELEEKFKFTHSIMNEATGTAQSTLKGVEGLKLELNTATAKLERYEKHVSNVDRGIEKHVINMERNLEKEQQDKNKLVEEVCLLKDSIDGLQTSLAQALQQMSTMRKQEKALRKLLKEEKRKSNLMDELMQKQKLELGEIMSLHQETVAQKSELNNEYREFEKKVAVNTENRDALLKKQSQHVEDLSQEIAKLNEDKIRFQTEKDILGTKMSEMEEKCNLLESTEEELCEALQELAAQKRNSEDLTSRLQVLVTEKLKVELVLQSVQKEFADLSMELDTGNRQLSESRQALERHLAKYQEEKSLSQNVLSDANSQHSDLRKRLMKEIKELGLVKQQLEQTVTETSISKQALEKEYLELSDKLLHATRLATEEKLERQFAESNFQHLKEIILQLESQKQDSTATQRELTEIVHNLNKKLEKLNAEKKAFEAELQSCQNQQDKLHHTNGLLNNKIINLQEELDAKKCTAVNLASQGDALNITQEHARITEERANRMAYELKEAREKLLSLRQREGKLTKEILCLQAEIRNLRWEARMVNGVKPEEKQPPPLSSDDKDNSLAPSGNVHPLRRGRRATAPD